MGCLIFFVVPQFIIEEQHHNNCNALVDCQQTWDTVIKCWYYRMLECNVFVDIFLLSYDFLFDWLTCVRRQKCNYQQFNIIPSSLIHFIFIITFSFYSCWYGITESFTGLSNCFVSTTPKNYHRIVVSIVSVFLLDSMLGVGIFRMKWT